MADLKNNWCLWLQILGMQGELTKTLIYFVLYLILLPIYTEFLPASSDCANKD